MVLRNRRGQSLMLALLVMFLLSFVVGLFITLIARNLTHARRSGEVLSAEYLCEAGIRYADDQLTYSADGADWRPMPTYPEVVKLLSQGYQPKEIETMLSYPDRPNEGDPDYPWLMMGFSRYNYGDGRFLIRVNYDPRLDSPMSRFIRIDSIGRVGVVEADDPTTWRLSQPMRARREKVAYKAIGITDYLRFITNKDRRPDEFSLGIPGFVTEFGVYGSGGGAIRVNGNLLWHGKNYVWLAAERGESVQVAGDIRHEIYSPINPPSDATIVRVNNNLVEPSSSDKFSTIPVVLGGEGDVGIYRDGRMVPDKGGYPRSIFRIEPPLLSGANQLGHMGRYRELTRNSGEWKLAPDPSDPGSSWWYNTGYYGWGDGLYISNSDDTQEETSIYTLEGDWKNPGSSAYWQGPYYTPPGMTIILTDDDLDGNNVGPDLILIRDSAPGRAKYIWYDPDGNLLPGQGESMIMPYPKNGVIFAEGNIRIKGTVARGKQLTVVSGATIYIEGNIIAEGPDTAIALLANDYVCINTTRFFGPVRGVFRPGNPGGQEPHFEVSPGVEGIFWVDFSFGASPQLPPALYVRHTSDGDVAGGAYMNMLVNFTSGDTGSPTSGLYEFSGLPSWPWIYAYPVVAVKEPVWEHQVFDLQPSHGNYDFYTEVGRFNRIGFQFDESIRDPAITKVNYLLSRVAVQPCDIRIDALLYAQNRSFFVIPGEWFNPDENDTEENAQARHGRPAYISDSRWPFYGQPLDVQIVVRGAISENIPASVSDVKAWMDKWGWIPSEHGSSGESTTSYREPLDRDSPGDNRRRGLTLIYDNRFSCPRLDPENPRSVGIRPDGFGRIRPITPNLPVSPQTLYFGEPT